MTPPWRPGKPGRKLFFSKLLNHWDVTAVEARDSIVARRLNCADTSLDLMPEDAAGTVRYVLTHRDVPRDVLAADAADALRLICGLDTALARLKYDTMTLARQTGVTWATIGALLGMRSAQGPEALYWRLRAEREGGPRVAAAGRAAQRDDMRRALERAQREGWLIRNGPAIVHAAETVLASPLPEDAADFAEEVSVALAGRPVSTEEVWAAIRVLLPGLPADALTLVAQGLVRGLAADWEAKFGG